MHRTGIAALVPAVLIDPTPVQLPVIPKTARVTRLVPVPPQGVSSGSVAAAAPRTQPQTAREQLGSRRKLYRTILAGAGLDGAMSPKKSVPVHLSPLVSARSPTKPAGSPREDTGPRRPPSPVEVSRILHDNKAREERMAESAKIRLEFFRHLSTQAEGVYQVHANRILAKNVQQLREREQQRSPHRQSTTVAGNDPDVAPSTVATAAV
jgi:hypothetical protein